MMLPLPRVGRPKGENPIDAQSGSVKLQRKRVDAARSTALQREWRSYDSVYSNDAPDKPRALLCRTPGPAQALQHETLERLSREALGQNMLGRSAIVIVALHNQFPSAALQLIVYTDFLGF